jgi:hypothetical protein
MEDTTMTIHNTTLHEAAEAMLSALAAGTLVTLTIERSVASEDELREVLQRLHQLATDRQLGVLLTPLDATTLRLRLVDT